MKRRKGLPRYKSYEEGQLFLFTEMEISSVPEEISSLIERTDAALKAYSPFQPRSKKRIQKRR